MPDYQKLAIIKGVKVMKNLEIVSLISLFGVIIPAIISFIVSKYQNKFELIKIHSEFIGQLYSKRLGAYLKIFELISEYAKIIKRKGIIYEELLDFYEKYSRLDSKSSLLFSYTTFHSDKLMKKVSEFLNCQKPYVFSNNQKNDLLNKLGYVETTMKLELGVYLYKDPKTIIKKFDIPVRKKKMIDDIMKNYSKGTLYNGHAKEHVKASMVR